MLELVGATVRRGDRDVLRRVNLCVGPATRMALVGPNGSGKSTLFTTLAGALELREGEVRVAGKALGRGRAELREHRRRVQLVVQDPDDQLLSADVAQDVSFGPYNLGLPEDEVRGRVQDALELFDITQLAGRATHQLSYGERKRVVSAGAIALRPSVLLLDEPSAGLDEVGTAGLLTALARLHERGTAIVLATHDVDLAYQWADEVAVLVDGELTQTDAATGLGDPELMRVAHLRVPHAITVGRALGLDPLPRTVDAALRTHKGQP
ncbi:energy-coupling factor ABC transporter ATP-binding protein [Tessaracoccus massiliensis]|uniref:energy-coupling factor ABC transporter ATP-binding protein n=1 Tax=Tessaracoccus massiliensis TaxID=1522311 RepID=UPI00058B9238|nr:ATP-binding cassette domain-containing protein [Tessaracoccus massiliensis]